MCARVGLHNAPCLASVAAAAAASGAVAAFDDVVGAVVANVDVVDDE